jgi:hypothetical protein
VAAGSGDDGSLVGASGGVPALALTALERCKIRTESGSWRARTRSTASTPDVAALGRRAHHRRIRLAAERLLELRQIRQLDTIHL